jgi:hypothetical protein
LTNAANRKSGLTLSFIYPCEKPKRKLLGLQSAQCVSVAYTVTQLAAQLIGEADLSTDGQTRVPQGQTCGTSTAFIEFNLLRHSSPGTRYVFAHSYLPCIAFGLLRQL